MTTAPGVGGTGAKEEGTGWEKASSQSCLRQALIKDANANVNIHSKKMRMLIFEHIMRYQYVPYRCSIVNRWNDMHVLRETLELTSLPYAGSRHSAGSQKPRPDMEATPSSLRRLDHAMRTLRLMVYYRVHYTTHTHSLSSSRPAAYL